MLTFLTWQFFLGLFVVGVQSLSDWNVDSQTSGDIASLKSMPENEIYDIPRPASANTDGVSEFAQSVTEGGNGVNPDKLVDQNSCTSNRKRLSRRIRARDEDMCPTDRFQLNDGEQKGRQILPEAPNAQQDEGVRNSGGSGKPKFHLAIPPKDAQLPYMFIPEEHRPKENRELCPEIMHPVPVCGRPSDAYISTYPYRNQLIVDPCYRCMCFLCLELRFIFNLIIIFFLQ